MAEKSNKSLIIGIAVAVVAVIAIVVGVIIAKGNDNGVGGGSSDETGTSQIEDDGSVSDYSDVDVMVGYGDYDVMYAQSKAIQNGEMVGRIIEVDGVVSHPMSKYSIGELDEDGLFIGTEFEIEGADADSYPSDGDHVIITGEVVEKSPLYYIIKTSPEYVMIMERAEEEEEIEEVEEDL